MMSALQMDLQLVRKESVFEPGLLPLSQCPFEQNRRQLPPPWE